jgi:DNA-binding response OmpR family regulator
MKTVLLLDDDRVFRRLIQAILEPKGYRVLQAGHACDADQLLAKETPDLVVLDGLLPDTTGVDWLTKCRGAGCTWPVLFVTSFSKTLREFNVLTRTLGAVDFLRKPIEPQAVVLRLQAMLGDLSASVASASTGSPAT